jgi:tRNA(Ile)-lysidine synthase
LIYLKEQEISFVKDESNFKEDQDRNYVRNTIIPSIEQRWANVTSRISNTANFIKIRNNSYEMFFKEKYQNLIGNQIKVSELKKIQKSFIVDIIRLSIKRQNIAMPSKKVIEEIIKTFIQSNPRP